MLPESKIFETFDFSVLDDPNYGEDAVREDLISPLLKALGFQPKGRQRMQRSQTLIHPFVMIGSQKRKINIIPDYTLWYDDQAILILDAKRPSEPIVKSVHVEQAFSYAIHPDVRTKSYALCNGREFVLYDIDRFDPVFQIELKKLADGWTDVLKHLSPEALLDHHHRVFLPDLGIFLKNAGFGQFQDITLTDSRIQSLGRTLGGGLTATAAHEMIPGTGFQGSFDMPYHVLPAILSCLPEPAAKIVEKALLPLGSQVYIGGIIEITWSFELGDEIQHGLYKDDPILPLIVRVIRSISRREALDLPLDGIPPDVVNVPSIVKHLL